MKIKLTQGKYAIVGPLDYTYLMQWKWYYNKAHKGGYAVRIDRTNSQRLIYMHRVILKRMGYEDFAASDHINRDKLDNRRCNLRPATDRQSACNRSKFKTNTSGYIGVYWHKSAQKWRALIQVNGKLKHLGLYDDLKEAVRVRDKATLKYHEKFAVLNYPLDKSLQ